MRSDQECAALSKVSRRLKRLKYEQYIDRHSHDRAGCVINHFLVHKYDMTSSNTTSNIITQQQSKIEEVLAASGKRIHGREHSLSFLVWVILCWIAGYAVEEK
mmetsp:Transcript_15682/g.25779  ORF Transcript_15682/g.25779 Transcript_15682/m.25779 type:complete len:103 (+) Transcript_15682:102-410(+)